jgi:predicted amidophosphoribosyltransferase
MNHAICKQCNKPFIMIKSLLCANCAQQEDVDYDKVRTYIIENPDNTIAEVSEGTGVNVKRILRFIKEERLEMSPGIRSEGLLKCTKCKVPIDNGDMCASCMAGLSRGISEINVKVENKGSGGMHSKRATTKR